MSRCPEHVSYYFKKISWIVVSIPISQVSQSDLGAMKGNSFEVFYTSKFEVIFIIMVKDAGDNQEICKNNKLVGGFHFYQLSLVVTSRCYQIMPLPPTGQSVNTVSKSQHPNISIYQYLIISISEYLKFPISEHRHLVKV